MEAKADKSAVIQAFLEHPDWSYTYIGSRFGGVTRQLVQQILASAGYGRRPKKARLTVCQRVRRFFGRAGSK